MVYKDTNISGSSGEHFAAGALMIGEYFRVEVIAGKCPAFDLYVEVNDEAKPFPLLIQIKTTSMDDRYNKTSIKTPVEDKKLKWLADRPVPTYVGGFDLVKKILYLAPAFDRDGHYPSIPITHRIPITNEKRAKKELRLLKKDVISYWQDSDIVDFKSNYQSLL